MLFVLASFYLDECQGSFHLIHGITLGILFLNYLSMLHIRLNNPPCPVP